MDNYIKKFINNNVVQSLIDKYGCKINLSKNCVSLYNRNCNCKDNNSTYNTSMLDIYMSVYNDIVKLDSRLLDYKDNCDLCTFPLDKYHKSIMDDFMINKKFELNNNTEYMLYEYVNDICYALENYDQQVFNNVFGLKNIVNVMSSINKENEICYEIKTNSVDIEIDADNEACFYGSSVLRNERIYLYYDYNVLKRIDNLLSLYDKYVDFNEKYGSKYHNILNKLLNYPFNHDDGIINYLKININDPEFNDPFLLDWITFGVI